MYSRKGLRKIQARIPLDQWDFSTKTATLEPRATNPLNFFLSRKLESLILSDVGKINSNPEARKEWLKSVEQGREYLENNDLI
jgi:hypothetical protein